MDIQFLHTLSTPISCSMVTLTQMTAITVCTYSFVTLFGASIGIPVQYD